MQWREGAGRTFFDSLLCAFAPPREIKVFKQGDEFVCRRPIIHFPGEIRVFDADLCDFAQVCLDPLFACMKIAYISEVVAREAIPHRGNARFTQWI